jgi:cytochrome c-type biogenesis protein CcmH/NrfG
MEHYATADMPQVVPLLREAIRLDPGFAQAHNMLAWTLYPSRRFDEAFNEIETAMQLAPKLPERERLVIETNYYRMTGDTPKMFEKGQQIVSMFPDEPRMHMVLGQVLESAAARTKPYPFSVKQSSLRRLTGCRCNASSPAWSIRASIRTP